MGFRIHPIFSKTNTSLKTIFISMLLEKGFECNKQCFISHTLWDDVFQNITNMDFYNLMKCETITIEHIKEIKKELDNINITPIDNDNKNLCNSYKFIMAFVDISLDLEVEWTIY